MWHENKHGDPLFHYVFFSLSCNYSISSFIGNLWRVLLLGDHLKFNNIGELLIMFSYRHLWLQRHLKYWQASRCPRSRPPNPWIPWFLLLLSPSFGIFLIALSFRHLSTLFATLATMGIVVFFNVWSFSRHRLQHISAIPNPALAGFFFGLIIQSLLCYFLYIMPHILWNNV